MFKIMLRLQLYMNFSDSFGINSNDNLIQSKFTTSFEMNMYIIRKYVIMLTVNAKQSKVNMSVMHS